MVTILLVVVACKRLIGKRQWTGGVKVVAMLAAGTPVKAHSKTLTEIVEELKI